jgi:glycosyltransferase involved in cell wall biosynthesis
LAVDAFNALGLKLKVVGEGEEVARQKTRAGQNIEFLGRVSDADRNRLFSGARGFIWPQEEDFGMTALEAMSAGCPVIAYNRGGSAEYMTEGVTGVLFDVQSGPCLIEAIRKFEQMDFDEKVIRDRARQFDVHVFRRKMRSFIETSATEFNRSVPVDK